MATCCRRLRGSSIVSWIFSGTECASTTRVVSKRALAGGFDSRVLLSFFNSTDDIRTHTYGVPGCDDILEARKLVALLERRKVIVSHTERSVLDQFTYKKRKVAHREVTFDSMFAAQLPQHALDAVWLSSGLERVARATLAHVYSTVGADAEALVSGICGDQLFRGHGNVPSIVSETMATVFRTGKLPDDLALTCEDIFIDASWRTNHRAVAV